MVARNLDRGSGFLHPKLDTAPFPNFFWVEPPIYAATVVAFHRLTGLELEPAGRLVSALAMTLGGWGLFGLTRRREGGVVAILALAAFTFFPLTIRYGRAFQPDAMMLGCLLAGFRCWDQYERGDGQGWIIPGGVLIAVGLALKIVWAPLLVPLITLRHRRDVSEDRASGSGKERRIWLARCAQIGLLVVPALLWYLHAASAIADGGGSRASADNRAIWMRVLVPTALLHVTTWANIGKFLCVRAFTPLGFLLGAVGALAIRGLDSLWRIWTATVLMTLSLLAAKLHHEYYWLMLAPVMAVGVGRSFVWLGARQRPLAVAVGLALLGLSAVQSRSTWRTPPEWSHLREAAKAIQDHVPNDALVVAPEALLFEADRRGCRLELTGDAAMRAAGEWGGTLDRRDPLALIAFYKRQGARYLADVATDDRVRLALHKAIGRRYKIVVARPGVLLADLTVKEEAPDGTR